MVTHWGLSKMVAIFQTTVSSVHILEIWYICFEKYFIEVKFVSDDVIVIKWALCWVMVPSSWQAITWTIVDQIFRWHTVSQGHELINWLWSADLASCYTWYL